MQDAMLSITESPLPLFTLQTSCTTQSADAKQQTLPSPG